MITKSKKVELEKMLEKRTIQHYSAVTKRSKSYGVIYTRVSSQEQAENNSSLEL